MFFNLSPAAKTAMDKVLEQFKSGNLAPVIQCARIKPDPADKKPSDAWTIRNRILAYLTTGSLDCRGYRQWQEVKRQVKKGETSGYILAPITRKVDDNGDERPVLVGFKGIPVFGLEQTDGEPLPAFDYRPGVLPPLTDLAKNLGIEIQWRADLPLDRLADCSRDGKEIRMASHEPEVFWHELGHAMHVRLLENDGLELQPGSHAETVAEFTATVLAEIYGDRDATGKAWQYISTFNSNPLAAINAAIDEVTAIVAEIERIK